MVRSNRGNCTQMVIQKRFDQPQECNDTENSCLSRTNRNEVYVDERGYTGRWWHAENE